jgi:hypothetical protein
VRQRHQGLGLRIKTVSKVFQEVAQGLRRVRARVQRLLG